MSDVQFYDPSSYLLEEQQSPRLEAIEPTLEHKETPPPIATRDSSLEPSDDEEEGGPGGGGNKRSRDEERPPQGDFVLLRQSAPHLPHISNYALKKYIDSPRRGQEQDRMIVDEDGQPDGNNSADQNAENDVDDEDTWKMMEPPSDIGNDRLNEGSKPNGVRSPMSRPAWKDLAPAPEPPPTKPLDVRPPPLTIKTGRTEEDSIARSPALARFTIDPANADPSNTLAALQMSPPRSSTAGSPEPKPNLPSLTATLSDAGKPFSGQSPSFTRASPSQQYGPSLHSAMSPPSVPTHPAFYRTSTTSTPSDYTIVSASASGSISTPASSIFHQSPAAAHPTSSAASPEQTRIDSSAEQVLSPESEEHEMNGMEGPFSNSIYKCSFPDCTAAPFQTQYLLNSHMNVHSDTRPHYCPVTGCARGPGGQGFKRKNEMIRWVCPCSVALCTTLTFLVTVLFICPRATRVLSAPINNTNIPGRTICNVMCVFIMSTRIETILCCETYWRKGLRVVAEGDGED